MEHSKISEENMKFEQSHGAEKFERRDPLGLFTFILLQLIKKFKEFPLEASKSFRKKVTKPKKGRSHSNKKVERELFYFGMILYFMLETLDAFKVKY